ncbi:RluA family pseudouridine synthase [Desulfocurvus sp. DL9XJH121]
MTGNEKSGARHVTVTPEEAGQKLAQFLRRRLGPDTPDALIMRIVRTGQVRVDKGRAKPFQRLAAGQDVRIPPLRPADNGTQPAPQGGPLSVIHEGDGYLALAKPAGLPVQPGTGHTDAVSERLRAQFPDAAFTPTPAHRLDRDTSGLLLVGTSYLGLRALQEAFAEHRVGKFYLAWVQGTVQEGARWEMRDQLAKQGTPGAERVRAGAGKTALALARCLETRDGVSLLEIDLRTGRTHQIRVQLAERGTPVVGDRKYGYNGPKTKLKLHAWKLVPPQGPTLELLPEWKGRFEVRTVPSI